MTHFHILVVDDDPKIVEVVAGYLSMKGGYRVSRANGGRQAMEFLGRETSGGEQPVDLVVMDMRMPGLSGRDVLTWLRNHPTLSYTRVIMLTAATGSAEMVDALSAGADDYIVKPFRPEELLARIQTTLRTVQLEKQLQRQTALLAALNRAGNAITATLDFRQIPAAAADGARSLLGVELAAIFLYDRERDALVCQAVSGRPPGGDVTTSATGSYRAVTPGVGIIGSAFATKSPLVVNQPSREPRFVPEHDLPAGYEAINLVALPLIVRNNPVGVLVALNKLDEPISEMDTELLTSLGGAVSRAIENANLFQRVKSRQEELQESRDRLQAVIDGIWNPIYTIDQSWRLVSVNQYKAEQLHSAPDRLVGRRCYEALFARDVPCEGCLAAHTLAEKQEFRWSVSWQGEDYLPEEWEVHAYPVPGASADAARAVIVWQDRTEQRRLENSLLQAGKLAAIGQLAAGVAHEINNPLTVINANAELLKMLVPPEDDNYESVDLIAQAGERATKVVRQLLDFARQDQYAFEMGDVNDSIGQALRLVTFQIESADVSIVSELSPDLPQVLGSWEHLKTVWLNLLLNARDAVLERRSGSGRANLGRGEIVITTRLDAGGGHIQVLFKDNGPGINPAQLAHIFEPFYTTKAPGRGTGLGLATSHRIIEQHGGQMESFSRPNEGTTFIVHLPARGFVQPATLPDSIPVVGSA